MKSLKLKIRNLSKQDFKRLLELCHHSKNLYNQSLYILNEHYKATGKHLSYGKLDKVMKKTKNLEGKINYRLLKAGVSQQTLRKLDKNYTSFFAVIRKYKANKTAFKGVPRPPKYKKGKYYNLIYDNQRFQIKKGKVVLEKGLSIDLPKQLSQKKIQQIEIIPRHSFLEAIFVYKDEDIYAQVPRNTKVMAIDLGLNNLATCVSNGVFRPFLISGRPLKAINQFYNKKLSQFQSVTKKRNDKHWSVRLDKLTYQRNLKINDYLHKASAKIVAHCLKYQISNVVVGDVANSNYKINLGKKNNQNFVNISLGQFVEKLRYKLERHGIKFVVREESYTSKASFIDNDFLPTRGKTKFQYSFSGRRIKRGLYQSKFGFKLNADVNGAYNLLRKAIPKFSFVKLHRMHKGIEGWLIPYKLYIL